MLFYTDIVREDGGDEFVEEAFGDYDEDEDNTWLKSLTIGGEVKEIPTAFRTQKELEELIIEEGVTTIGSIFTNCQKLKTVVIPRSVTSLRHSSLSRAPL